MNKLDLIAAFKSETGLTKSEATAVVDLFFNEMTAALEKGDRVEIRGLCSIDAKKHTKLLACTLWGCLPEDNTSDLLTI